MHNSLFSEYSLNDLSLVTLYIVNDNKITTQVLMDFSIYTGKVTQEIHQDVTETRQLTEHD